MTRKMPSRLGGMVALLTGVAASAGFGTAVLAQQSPASPPGAAAPAPAPAANPMTSPAMSGPIAANPDPLHLAVPPLADPVYVTGAATAFGMAQTDPVLPNHSVVGELTNFQAAVQTTSGMFQFFLEPGAYSFPSVGYPYVHMGPTVHYGFGGLPVAWGKVVFNDNFSIQGGKLPTLIGAEYMFTFENMNIERGLLWGQENIINRGIQANLTTGPVAWSLSFNDGFYTGQYNYVTGLAAWTINSANSLALAGGGPFDRVTATNTPVGPQYNNSTMIEAAYTYAAAPWTITPYIQYTHVDQDAGLGLVDSSTFGGAILANYQFTDKINLAGRWEYIGSSGAATVGGGGLLGFGSGSSAMSFTLTPTYQNGIFFLRGEASVTQLYNVAAGAGFGSGNSTTQARFLLETGIVF